MSLKTFIAGLSLIALAFGSYYFAIINQVEPPTAQAAPTTTETQEVRRKAADALLASRVKGLLTITRRLYRYDLGVEARAGVITLTGSVNSETDRELAEQVAQATPDVRQVVNQLQLAALRLPSTAELSAGDNPVVEDLEVAADLRERLRATPDLKELPIQVSAHNHAVTLSGSVATEAQRLKAEQVARALPGLVSVTNQIQLGSPARSTPEASLSRVPGSNDSSLSDSQLTALLAAAFLASRADFTDVAAIKPECRNAVATLSGSVASRAERSLAERVARETSGVKEVINQLTISPPRR